jgi:3-methylcrotonyl-CoA carboxylase beta subunit
MRKIKSMISVSSAEFRANEAHNRKLAQEFREKREVARFKRPQRDLERLARQGKMLPRERIEKLLDPGTPFLELSSLAANIRTMANLHRRARL